MEAGANKKEAVMGEAKTQNAAEEDLSMEEILQSIRRIIAEDDNDGKKPAAADNAKSKTAKSKASDNEVPGSDVLELTEMLKEDGTVETVKTGQEAQLPPKEAKPTDVLNTIDEALVKPAEAKQAEPEKPVTVEKPAEKPAEPSAAPVVTAPEPVMAPAVPASEPQTTTNDSLLSVESASAAAAAFKRLQTVETITPPAVTTSAPAFRDGTTVEDLVTEMLRPMMKAWLDANLPPIVERIVEREVKKLTK